jgi:hypothetical protein
MGVTLRQMAQTAIINLQTETDYIVRQQHVNYTPPRVNETSMERQSGDASSFWRRNRAELVFHHLTIRSIIHPEKPTGDAH